MRHAPQPLLWSPPASAAAAMEAPPIGQTSDRSIGAQSRLQIRERCWRRRRSQLRRQQLPLLSNVPRSDAGVLGPPCTTKAPPGARRPDRWHPLRTIAGAPTTAVAPPLMEGRSAPLPPRRRWEGHWWWPGRPSAAARGARAAVAACRRTTSKCPLTTSKCPLRRPAPRAILFSTKQNSSQLRKLKRAGWKH